MAARHGYNMNSAAVKRIMQEARELANDPCTDYTAAPLENDIFEWHCTIRGTPDTEFEGGLYHFRILLPSEYPFRPPSIMMLTPNGRFELNTKICISFTNYHEELWQPAWGVRTAIIGLQGFFPLKGTAAVGVGALEYPATERKRLALLSRDWVCPTCKISNLEGLPDPVKDTFPTKVTHAEEPSAVFLPAQSEQGMPEKAFKVLEAATASTMADPPTPIHPLTNVMTPPILAPKPIRPIDAASIIIPATPSRPSTPVPSAPATPPIDIQPRPASAVHHHVLVQRAQRQGSPAHTPIPSPSVFRRSNPRPPILLDTAICVLLVSVFALICRRIL